jgi:hypothetical protein
MIKNQIKMYAPHQRDFYDLEQKEIRSYSQTDSTLIPDPVTDPIVSMNISCAEFDYTYNGGQEILDTEE